MLCVRSKDFLLSKRKCSAESHSDYSDNTYPFFMRFYFFETFLFFEEGGGGGRGRGEEGGRRKKRYVLSERSVSRCRTEKRPLGVALRDDGYFTAWKKYPKSPRRGDSEKLPSNASPPQAASEKGARR